MEIHEREEKGDAWECIWNILHASWEAIRTNEQRSASVRELVDNACWSRNLGIDICGSLIRGCANGIEYPKRSFRGEINDLCSPSHYHSPSFQISFGCRTIRLSLSKGHVRAYRRNERKGDAFENDLTYTRIRWCARLKKNVITRLESRTEHVK